jgi:hypothetical protein
LIIDKVDTLLAVVVAGVAAHSVTMALPQEQVVAVDGTVETVGAVRLLVPVTVLLLQGVALK